DEPQDRGGELPPVPRAYRRGNGDAGPRRLRDLLHPLPWVGRTPRAVRDERSPGGDAMSETDPGTPAPARFSRRAPLAIAATPALAAAPLTALLVNLLE